jgi:hypothetical protein
MDQLEQLEGDLRFVRNTVESAGRQRSPAAIYFLWAIAGLVGCALVDFRETWVPWCWGIAGPVGFAASSYLGWRHARGSGQLSRSSGWRYLLHWGGLMTAIGLAVLMPIGGVLPWEALNATILLILALGYFEAGVHLDRPLLWVGVLIAVGYVFVVFVSAYTWTIVGVALATALTMAGLRVERAHEAAA